MRTPWLVACVAGNGGSGAASGAAAVDGALFAAGAYVCGVCDTDLSHATVSVRIKHVRECASAGPNQAKKRRKAAPRAPRSAVPSAGTADAPGCCVAGLPCPLCRPSADVPANSSALAQSITALDDCIRRLRDRCVVCVEVLPPRPQSTSRVSVSRRRAVLWRALEAARRDAAVVPSTQVRARRRGVPCTAVAHVSMSR
jgi:hypothetical protein